MAQAARADADIDADEVSFSALKPVTALRRTPTLFRPGTSLDVFRALLVAGAVAAGITHFCLMLLFHFGGVAWLAEVNVASVLVYVLVWLLLRQGRARPAMVLMGFEIVGHGLLAVQTIGWDSGFHLYIILIIPVLIVNAMLRPPAKAVLVTGVGLLYVAMDWRWRGVPADSTAPPALVSGLYYFNLVSTLAILALLASVYYRLVRQAHTRLQDLARTDPLTQLRNRRAAMETAQREAARVARGAGPLAVLIADVDHFKQINDTHGHETGDEALKAIARVLHEGVREVDLVARWGGEEFLILLPGTEVAEAMAVAERLRTAVQQLHVGSAAGQPVSLAMTVGVDLLTPGDTFEPVLARADRALYAGKQAGRNRVVLASRPEN